MAISFSRPDPSSPAAVGTAQFDVVRRGFSQEEVRDFLRMVSSEMSRLQERERFLESELRALQTRGLSSPGVLDEETVTTLLGEETARVLSVAREAAQQMRLRAAETAERLVREASADASRIRQEAELEARRKREDASADVENEIELAKQQGRDMVNEAREYRERVLAELARRRELAREQIEMLIHARDRLVKAFDRARVAANEVVGDLDEFEELSEEVARASQMQKPDQGPVFFDHTTIPDAIPQRSTEMEERDIADEIVLVVDDIAEEVIEVQVEEVVVEEAIEIATTPIESESVATSEETAVKAGHPSVEPASTEHIAEVVQLFGRREGATRESTDVAPTKEQPPPSAEATSDKPKSRDTKPSASKKASVDNLFAKLKESSPAKVAESARANKPTKASKPAEEKPKVDQPSTTRPKAVVPKINTELFIKRDETLAPQIVTLTRKFKRVLADEENAILTYLQGKKAVVALEKILPDAANQVQAHVESLIDDIHNTALAGAKSVAPGLKADLRKRVTKAAVMQTVSKSIDETIVRPIRERLQGCIEQCAGDREQMTSLVRSVYREWKMQKIESMVADLACLAYSRGAFLALPTGTPVCWMVDPNGPQCADAEDNALAGDTPLGSPFPTGHEHPTAHAGCRCLVAPHRD